MFCGNCGTENANGAKFCKKCGKSLAEVENRGVKMSSIQNKPTSTDNANSISATKVDVSWITNRLKSMPKGILVGACVAVIALVVIICVAINARNTINLDKYLTVEATGYDGYGTAKVVIDWDAIEQRYGSKISFNSAAKKAYGDFLNIVTPIDAIRENVFVRLEESEGLSNGTTIAYIWDVDEELSKYVKCKLKYKDDKYIVSGLTEVGTFDAFADLVMEFSGVAPNGSANLNYTGSEMSYYDFDCDKTNGLSNGDTITVKIDNTRLKYYAENLGKVPETLEKDYKVEGLDSYLMKIGEIDDTALAAMRSQAADVYNAYAAKNWGKGESLESFTYIGNYLLTAKNKDTWEGHNFLYLVYKAQVRNNYDNGDKSYNKLNDDYWFIRFDELMVSSDGSVNVDITEYSTPRDKFTIDSGVSSGIWGTKSWYYYGYNTLNELYKAVVTQNMDTYNHEDNVDESVAPETIIEEVPQVSETGYILSNSDTKLLSKEDLQGLSAEECKIARNEIYARHGRKFKDEELQAYFNACNWYEGKTDPDDFKDTDLTEIELANKELIVEYEKEKGYR